MFVVILLFMLDTGRNRREYAGGSRYVKDEVIYIEFRRYCEQKTWLGCPTPMPHSGKACL